MRSVAVVAPTARMAHTHLETLAVEGDRLSHRSSVQLESPARDTRWIYIGCAQAARGLLIDDVLYLDGYDQRSDVDAILRALRYCMAYAK